MHARVLSICTMAVIVACAGAPKPATAPDRGWSTAQGVRADDCVGVPGDCSGATPAACDAWIEAGGTKRVEATRVLEEGCARRDRCACARYGRALSYDDARAEDAFRVLDGACRDGAMPACDDGLLLGALCAAKDAKPSALCVVLHAHGRVPAPEPEPPKLEELPLRAAMRGCFLTVADGSCPKVRRGEAPDAWGASADQGCGWRVPAATLLCFDDDGVRERVAPGAFDERRRRKGAGEWDFVPVRWRGVHDGSARMAQQGGEEPFALREEGGRVVLESGDWRTPLTPVGPQPGAPLRADLRRTCAHARACIAALVRAQPPGESETEGEVPAQEVHGLLACLEEERAAVRVNGGAVPAECR